MHKHTWIHIEHESYTENEAKNLNIRHGVNMSNVRKWIHGEHQKYEVVHSNTHQTCNAWNSAHIHWTHKA